MFLSDIPNRVAIPFANAAGSGYIRPIPVPSQIGIVDGAASFTDGFPPDTFQPLSGGGAYVNGEDVNGILNFVTAWTRWTSAGGAAIFNSSFATAIGGYPKLATLQSVSSPGVLWVSSVDGNLTDPDGGSPVGWHGVGPAKATDAECLAGTDDTKYVTPHGLHAAVLAAVPAKASLPEAQTGTNDSDFITPLVLRQLLSLSDSNQSIQIGPLIIKWGIYRVVQSGEGATPITYPTPFPTNTLAVVACGYVANPYDVGNDMWAHVSTRDANGFIYNRGASSGGNTSYGFDWIAIGN